MTTVFPVSAVGNGGVMLGPATKGKRRLVYVAGWGLSTQAAATRGHIRAVDSGRTHEHSSTS